MGNVDAGKEVVIEVPIDPQQLVTVVNVQVKMAYTLFKTKRLKIHLTPNEIVNLSCGKSRIRNKTYLKISNVQKNQDIKGFIAQGASRGVVQAVVGAILKGVMK